ncbi:MAG TPA: hypothetical protein VGI95_21060 [Caulobacteraceae bacterium]|jgi:hypothetical protein
MNTFTKTLLIAGGLAALVGCGQGGPAAAPTTPQAAGGSLLPTSLTGGGPTTFTDPTENAFTVSVPAGWTAKGGVQRGSATYVRPWVQAASADGASTISLGDPSIPPFVEPSDQHPAGSSFQGLVGQQVSAEPYETGAQFAADYAQRSFGASCQGLQQTGGQPEPDLVQAAQADTAKLAASVGVAPPQIDFDGASAQFTCQANGVPYVVGVMAVTSHQQSSWGVPLLVSYRTPAASQAPTDAAARAMRASFQHQPQWDAQMAAATRQQLAQIQAQGQQQMAMLQAQQQRNNAMLNANETAANERLNAGHAAFMQQFNAQGDARNAAWRGQMYNKETNHQSEMRYINNQTCVAWYDAAHTRCSATAQY